MVSYKKIYMEQPPGFEQRIGLSPLVCNLNEAIYGLKQAPRAWVERLQQFLLSIGFVSSKADCSLFIRITDQSTIFLLVYIDDIIITGSSANDIQILIQQLNTEFSFKDLGDLHNFQGIEVTKTYAGIHLSQNKICYRPSKVFSHGKGQLSTHSHGHNISLSSERGSPMSNTQEYRNVVGALQINCN